MTYRGFGGRNSRANVAEKRERFPPGRRSLRVLARQCAFAGAGEEDHSLTPGLSGKQHPREV